MHILYIAFYWNCQFNKIYILKWATTIYQSLKLPLITK